MCCWGGRIACKAYALCHHCSHAPLPQERHAIGLAIRREVARAYRRIVVKGGKPEGSSKLWQQVRRDGWC